MLSDFGRRLRESYGPPRTLQRAFNATLAGHVARSCFLGLATRPNQVPCSLTRRLTDWVWPALHLFKAAGVVLSFNPVACCAWISSIPFRGQAWTNTPSRLPTTWPTNALLRSCLSAPSASPSPTSRTKRNLFRQPEAGTEHTFLRRHVAHIVHLDRAILDLARLHREVQLSRNLLTDLDTFFNIVV